MKPRSVEFAGAFVKEPRSVRSQSGDKSHALQNICGTGLPPVKRRIFVTEGRRDREEGEIQN